MKKLTFTILLLILIVFIGWYVYLERQAEKPPVVEPSLVSPWTESKVGLVYAQETQYVKPSPDGRYLYIFSVDSRNIIVLDIENRIIVQDIKMPGLASQVTEMIFSSDRRWMYTLDAGVIGDGHVVIIDTKTHKISRLIPLSRSSEPGSWFGNIAMSPDEQFLYISYSQGIYRMNIENEQVTKVSAIGYIPCLLYTSDAAANREV